jgi:hypothetical protein
MFGDDTMMLPDDYSAFGLRWVDGKERWSRSIGPSS